MHLAEAPSHATQRLPDGEKPLRSTTPTQQWTSIEKQQHKNSQIALIGECMAATHKNSAGVELHIRRIMLAFKKPTKPTKSNSNNANTPACACLLGVY